MSSGDQQIDTDPPTAAPGPAATTAPDHRDASPAAEGARRSRAGWWLTGGGLAVALIGMIALIGVAGQQGSGGLGDQGYAVIQTLLSDEQVQITRTSTLADTIDRTNADATVVIWSTPAGSQDLLSAVLAAGPGRVVLINPRLDDGDWPSVPVRTAAEWGPGIAAPSCGDPMAARAGAIAVDSAVAVSGVMTMACYPVADGFLYGVIEVDDQPVTILNVPFTNTMIGREGNASLAMQVLGQHPRVVWFTPTSTPIERGSRGESETPPTLLGPTWPHAVGLALLALGVCAIWRGRRLGPIITERLPVVVPASETVEGHGRLYARLGARAHAAEQLRAATRRRLASRLGRHDDPEILVQVLIERTPHAGTDLRQWLDGPAPANDDELVTLTRRLEDLEQEIRRP